MATLGNCVPQNRRSGVRITVTTPNSHHSGESACSSTMGSPVASRTARCSAQGAPLRSTRRTTCGSRLGGAVKTWPANAARQGIAPDREKG
eukprot:scaffold27882_cov61-Phaeocystis_antarctica.AAC.8